MNIISIQNLSHSYQNIPVFTDNSLDLEVAKSQRNKLFGIIGPSGSGKSTLLSILGGQLKPDNGTIQIKGTDIYSIGDIERRKRIAVQMQSSSALRGSLKTNLVFGLFGGATPYSDEDLIDVLKKIGLWSLFSAKDGLETLIGEGGVNLSGGQRQRLNFAGLYLRAKHYKPSLILIDEPTSSLDDISEKAITNMISELAVSATTLVVAHRLKTLEKAIGVLDISITQPNTSLTFYTPSELLQVSHYFRDLQSGLAKLEE